jgi:hypothetical protein
VSPTNSKYYFYIRLVSFLEKKDNKLAKTEKLLDFGKNFSAKATAKVVRTLTDDKT